MKITAKYLILPINMQSKCKTVLFYDKEGKLIFDFEGHLDPLNPRFYTYLDVERFRGMELTVAFEPEMELTLDQTEIKPAGSDYLRPAIHFAPDYGWLNDPNGLVYHKGIYHLFYQINPVETDFGSMHWGHATSTDLIHWEDGEFALYPDDMGTMFSGCGFIDKKNVTGLSPDGDTMLLFYTAAAEHTRTSRGKKFTQCLAYSTDNGKTVTKYEKNPIVENFHLGNRDTKVVWCEELECYIMALFLGDKQFYYRLLESKNLIDWTPIQDVLIRDGVEECPDLYPLEIDGVRKWVFSGANDTYRLCHFDKETRQLVFDTEARAFHYGNASFAGQTYSNVPDGRTIRVVCNVFRDTKAQFSSQMGIPMEMSLVNLGGESYLKAEPVRELESLVKTTDSYRGSIKTALSKTAAYDITLKAPREADDFTVSFFGMELEIKPRENKMVCNRREIPLSLSGGDVELRMITDTFTVECYLDGGLVYAVIGEILDKNLNTLRVDSEAAEMTVKELDSIRDSEV